MQILVNKNNEITDYSMLGGFANGVNYSGALPTDFEANFKPKFYLISGSEIVKNNNFVEVQPEVPVETDPSPEQQAITALAQQVADLTEANTQLEQAITALATGGDN